MTLSLGGRFEQAVGYDISPHMLAIAQENAGKHQFGAQTQFQEVDVEEGIPVEDATISFVVMNLGTASDVRNIERVIKETLRVLKPGGRFLFSFYNRDALLYRWEFLPWPVSLVASINLHDHCLEVHSGNEVLSVYARPYTVDEVAALFRNVGVKVNLSTYSTMSAILPNDLFENQPGIQEAIVSLDENLSTSPMGAYIIATGQK
ncbi:methyltransferase domain-containing protein [Candidatus Kaiserbacteria bacterium]|nr:methyltransferase domain-containing protein [Candidatus Kaiserbacteria bacterium]